VFAIDYNSIAPAAATEDMFAPDDAGHVPRRINENGWLAAGVPGTLAGLDLAIKRFGKESFARVAAPAIELADKGFPLGQGVAGSIQRTLALIKADPGSARLLLKDGEPFKTGDHFRNPALAELLRTLSTGDATAKFYRGTVAGVIADAFSRNQGLVTTKDLAAYRAREVSPLESACKDMRIHTAPLTAGGLTVLEAFGFLQALDWANLPAKSDKGLVRLEALREAWRDRLTLLGDPDKASVPVRKLLSKSYATQKASDVVARVRSGKPLAFSPEPRFHGGTVHLSAADVDGNMAALTLTHGNSFGARVTVDEFGLILGHGMSRFEPKPGHPNSPGPHKRPLHNMCPTIVTRDDRPIIAIGGAGGRKIPNSVLDVLTYHLLAGMPMPDAIAAPRWHTEGDLNLVLEQKWPEEDVAVFKGAGYKVERGGGALVSAVWRDPASGAVLGTTR